jgi:TRAP-type mannitol/chloroaromatic compound transport system permease small subunit
MARLSKDPSDPIEAYENLIEHPETHGQPLASGIDRLLKSIGHLVMWANLLLIGAIVTQVGMRYVLNQSFPKLDEIQWHFYGLVTMVGISYALVTDSHVRVDLLHMRLNQRTRRVIEVIGILTLLTPFIWLMIDQGWDYFHESLRVNERSDSSSLFRRVSFFWRSRRWRGCSTTSTRSTSVVRRNASARARVGCS